MIRTLCSNYHNNSIHFLNRHFLCMLGIRRPESANRLFYPVAIPGEIKMTVLIVVLICLAPQCDRSSNLLIYFAYILSQEVSLVRLSNWSFENVRFLITTDTRAPTLEHNELILWGFLAPLGMKFSSRSGILKFYLRKGNTYGSAYFTGFIQLLKDTISCIMHGITKYRLFTMIGQLYD